MVAPPMPRAGGSMWPPASTPLLLLRADPVGDRVDALVLVQRLVVIVRGRGLQVEDDLLHGPVNGYGALSS